MILEHVDSLGTEVCLARAVLHPERPGYPLLQAGNALSGPVLERLRQLGIEYVWVGEGEPAAPDHPCVQADRVLVRHGELVDALRRQFANVRKRGRRELNLDEMQRRVAALAAEIAHNPGHSPPVMLLARGRSDLAAHTANVAYYTLLLALHLPKYVRMQRSSTTSAELWETLREVGLAAVLHDVGKLSERYEYLKHPFDEQPQGLDYDAADEAYCAHAALGAELLGSDITSTVRYTIVHHHLRWDGRGFPQRPAAEGRQALVNADRIHIYARMVTLADAADHLLAGRHGPHEILGRLGQLAQLQTAGMFDPTLASSLLRMLPPFPLGSRLELSDGTRAVVREHDVQAPCRPVVAVCGQGRGGGGANGVLRLCDRPELRIVRVNGHALRGEAYQPVCVQPDPLTYWSLREVVNGLPTTEEVERAAVQG